MRALPLLTTLASASALILASCSSGLADADPANGLDGAETGFTGDELELDDFIGTVIVETGPGMNRSVSIQDGEAVSDGELDAPRLKQTSNGFLIEGDDSVKVKSCSPRGDVAMLQLKGHSKRPLVNFPTVRITAPTDIEIELKLKGGNASIADVTEADVSVAGCGDISLNNVTDSLEASINGSGDIFAADVGSLEAAIRGSGDIEANEISGAAELSIAGSGDIQTGRVGGSLDVEISGSGRRSNVRRRR